MSRSVVKTYLSPEVEAILHKKYVGLLYFFKAKQIISNCKALNIKPCIDHVSWDEDMWRMELNLSKKWYDQRESIRPKEAKKIVFDRPSLLQCGACEENKVWVEMVIQKRGCDEPRTVYCVCKNPECKKKLGYEKRWKTEG